MTAAAPWEWKQMIAETLQEAKVIPLWGMAPAFPWEALGNTLAEKWKLSDLQIKSVRNTWGNKQEALRGLGGQPEVVALDVSPLEEGGYLAISNEEMQLLAQAVLQPPGQKDRIDVSLARGCFKFLLLQTLQLFSETKTYSSIHVKIAEEHPLPEGNYLICEFTLQWSHGRIFGKLLLPSAFPGAFRKLHSIDPAAYFQTPIAHNLPMSLRVIAGRCTLPLSQWQQANTGDFLKLDSCTISPGQLSGRASLLLYETPLFDTEIKQGKVTLLDYAFYQEDTMKDPIDDEDEGETREEEEFEDEDEFDEEEIDEEIEEEAAVEEEPLEEEKIEAIEEMPPLPVTGKETLEQAITSREIPITLVVEIGRVQMNLEKLLGLEPGNVIELAEHINSQVRVCSGGKCLATGELIALGETVGVKITKIGP